MVAAALVVVILVAADRVTICQEATLQTIIVSRGAKVVAHMSVLVFHDVRVAVLIYATYVEWVDGGDILCIDSWVFGTTARIAQIWVRVHVAVHPTHVGEQMQPLGSLVVGFETGSETLVARICQHTALLKIAYRRVV